MATLKDVAKETGLTVTTISRVLNNRGYISEETREKVYAAMKKLNYQPNEVARSLSKQSSNTIGVIVPHIRHPYFADLISNLENQAYQRKYKILLFNSREKHEKMKKYLEMCASNRVAGIILCSGNVELDNMQSLNIPLVTIERYLENGTAAVECDNYHGGKIAAQHLIDRGCKQLLCFSGIYNNAMPADSRAVAFRETCQANQIECKEITTSMVQYNDLEYYEFIEKFLRENPKVDGIFASSDLIAAQVIQICAKMKKRIPEDIKLVGFDDVNISMLTTPRITTIHQPIKEMAATAVDLVINASQGNLVPSRTMLPVALVEREST